MPVESSQLQPGQSVMTMLSASVSRTQWQSFLSSMSELEQAMLKCSWPLWARKEQMQPPEFRNGQKATWFICGGRGYGKTRVGSETVNGWAKELGQTYGRGHIALIGKDPSDTRDVMIENQESGILAISAPWFRPLWEPTKRRLTWPNGVIATTYSSETPDDLRGPQHHKAWCDEPAKWKHPDETWDQLQFGLRLGDHPQTVVTGTPRPIKLIIAILEDPDTVVTRGKTDDNKVNLSSKFIRDIYKRYHGTRLGRQELNAELLSDTPGALWTMAMVEECRVKTHPDLVTLVVAIDPNVTDPKDDPEMMDGIAECGIVCVGRGEDGHGYVTHDFSGHWSADTWGTKAVAHYDSLRAEKIIAETNNGGDLVEFVIKSAAQKLGMEYNFKKVTASRGKRTRAEPVSALYEQKRMHHVGAFPELEDQMTTWVPGMKSPDRMDAMVWGATEVMLHSAADLVW